MSDEKLVFHIQNPGTNEFSSRRLVNYEAPLYPKFIDEELTLAVGRDRFNDPFMRIVWSQRLYRVVNGKQMLMHPCQSYIRGGELYQIGYPRFIVQQKMDPVFVGLDTWDEKLQGTKPYTGVYTFLACVQTTKGGFRLPDRTLLEALKALDWNKRHATLYGSHMEKPPEEASQWAVTKMMSDIDIAEQKAREEQKDRLRRVLKENQRRIFSKLPNEGRARDPYREAQKQREKAYLEQHARRQQEKQIVKQIVLTDL